MQMPTSSSSSDETTSTPRPGLREVADDPVDLGLRRDVDAARRLVEQQHAALAQQPAREHDLLLVAAREQPNDAVGVVGHGVQRPQLLARRARAPSRTSEQPAREAVEVGEAHVLRRAPVEDERLRLAVLGREAEPGRDRARRAAGRQPLALDEDLALLRAGRGRRSGGGARCGPSRRARRGRRPRPREPAGSRRARPGSRRDVREPRAGLVGADRAARDRAARPCARP